MELLSEPSGRVRSTEFFIISVSPALITKVEPVLTNAGIGRMARTESVPICCPKVEIAVATATININNLDFNFLRSDKLS